MIQKHRETSPCHKIVERRLTQLCLELPQLVQGIAKLALSGHLQRWLPGRAWMPKTAYEIELISCRRIKYALLNTCKLY